MTTDLGGTEGANAVAVQADGKIVAAGFSASGFTLVRYTTGGSLDPSFGSGGVVTTFFRGYDGVQALLIQPDGKIVAAGSAGGFGDFALARYNPDGSLDTSFGTGGTVTTVFTGASCAFGVALQPDGKIVAAGQGANGFFDLARYNLNGSLDATFGTGGLVMTALSGSVTSVVLQADGKIVAAGGASPTGFPNSDFALVRYNADGSVDPSFGSGGEVLTDFGHSDGVVDLAIQPNGKLVAGGISLNYSDPSVGDFVLARYNADGSLDPSFGTAGKVDTAFGGQAVALALALQGDGKIVAGGELTLSATNGAFALARYNADGTLDSGFGTGGKVTTDITPGFDGINSLALQADGKIVGAGPANNNDFAVARYLAGGGDTVPPVVTVPAALTAEATGPGGAAVTYTASAVDAVSGSEPVTCDHPSGSTFALGTTHVACSASDAAGNVGTASFDVTVRDMTPPVLSLPAPIVVDATSPAGAAVTYAATATDLVDGAVAVSCGVTSGTIFPVASTTVHCTAADAHGNPAAGSFTVHVRSAVEMLDRLIAASHGVGPGRSLELLATHAKAEAKLGHPRLSCGTLAVYIVEVRELRGKTIPRAQADALIAGAQAVRAALGC